MGGDLAPNLGGTKKFFRGPISEKISIFRVKISDDLFFGHRLGSSDFPFLFSHFPYVYYVKCRVYDHFLTRKPPFFTLFTFTHIRQHYFSKYWEGPMHGPSPHLKFWGDRPPYVSAPASLCRPAGDQISSQADSLTHKTLINGMIYEA